MPLAGRMGGGGRDRFVALAGLLGVTALAWLYLWLEAGHREAMSGGMGTMPHGGTTTAAGTGPWDLGALVLTFLMWTVMMVGMMLPSAIPAILLYGTLARKNRERGSRLPSTAVFTGGYLAIWTLFSLAATALQSGLSAARLVGPDMALMEASLSGGLLILAGLYQWLPFKDICLEKCRAPLQFFMMRWRPGTAGAFRMGAEHGLFCLGCCWALMLLLFAAGVMNLLWIALIAGLILLEKVLPGGRVVGRVAGILLLIAGSSLLVSGV